MKVHLMFSDRDADPKQEMCVNAAMLTQDLELGALFSAMAGNDAFVLDVVRRTVLSDWTPDVDTVVYRQGAALDCIANRSAVRELYAFSIEVIESKNKNHWSLFSKYPSSVLRGNAEIMALLVTAFKRLREFAATHQKDFRSEAFRTLFAMLQRELDDRYLAQVNERLKELKLDDGVLESAMLGVGNSGCHYTLRRPLRKRSWLDRLLDDLFRRGPPAFGFRVADRDQAGSVALSELQDRGINEVANAMAQSVEHVVSFFEMLRLELGFYVGCLNLLEALEKKGYRVTFPEPSPIGSRKLRSTGLYDASLALTSHKEVVSNSIEADGKSLIVITGANQGGKSSFLRTSGLAQVMMQAGMFVCADAYAGELCDGIFTHYKREEDSTLTSGKFDEELSRMSEIADNVRPGSLILFNESFAATNEREGSEVGRQIVDVFLDRRIKVFFVTHMFQLSNGLYRDRAAEALFLRADRQPDGTRTFRLVVAEPLRSSFGEDLYLKIFGPDWPGKFEPASSVMRH